MFEPCRTILTDLLNEEPGNQELNFMDNIVQVFQCGLHEHNCLHAKGCRTFIAESGSVQEPLVRVA
jgi:hypothetical protein